ncbi:MAG: tyrosine-type recombinase/integrase [Candidatus Bathycorpusculaceae bacterium]
MEVERLKPALRGHRDLEGIVRNFCEDCQLRSMSGKTIEGYRSCILIFLSFITREGVRVHNIDNQVLKDFLGYLKFERKIKHKTIKEYFSALSVFYDYLTFEGIVNTNIILPFRKRYLRRYKEDYDDPERKLLTVEEMSRLANSIIDPRDRAMVVLFAKTGVRRGELLKMDVDDINWEDYSITLKPTPKRSNRTVFFDEECAILLRRWLRIREKFNPKTKALFISYNTLGRLSRNGVWTAIVKYAKRLGFHNPNSPRLEDHFGPHCFRHWFTTWLLRNGMPREYVKELRGDKRGEAIDIYYHIDRQELRRAYLAYIPKLGI